MRRIPLSHRSHVIGFQPLRSGTAEHESALERDFVTLSSFLDPTASILAQPVTLHFRDGGRMRRYTPDFLVRSSHAVSQLVEVKYRRDLDLQKDRLAAGFAAARVWAVEHGAAFRLATDEDIRGALLENAKRLLPLRDAPLDERLSEEVIAAVRSLGAHSFGEVLERFTANRSATLATIWRLIARGMLRVDLAIPITLQTSLGLP